MSRNTSTQCSNTRPLQGNQGLCDSIDASITHSQSQPCCLERRIRLLDKLMASCNFRPCSIWNLYAPKNHWHNIIQRREKYQTNCQKETGLSTAQMQQRVRPSRRKMALIIAHWNTVYFLMVSEVGLNSSLCHNTTSRGDLTLHKSQFSSRDGLVGPGRGGIITFFFFPLPLHKNKRPLISGRELIFHFGVSLKLQQRSSLHG